MAETNKNNFLRWSNANNDNTLLPFPQIAEPNVKCTQPILVRGEETYFYWDELSNTASGGIVGLCDLSKNVIYPVIGTLSAFTHLNGNHAIGSFTCPSDIPQGFYLLYIEVGLSEKLYSNVIEVLVDSNLISETAVFEFWDTKQIRSFKYPYLTNFKQKFRLRYDKSNGKYFKEQEVQTYLSGTDKTISERSYKYFTMKILEADESMRDAVECMLSHSFIKVNNTFYDYKNDSGITISGEGEILANVEFEMKNNYNRVTC